MFSSNFPYICITSTDFSGERKTINKARWGEEEEQTHEINEGNREFRHVNENAVRHFVETEYRVCINGPVCDVSVASRDLC